MLQKKHVPFIKNDMELHFVQSAVALVHYMQPEVFRISQYIHYVADASPYPSKQFVQVF
jgi:hypothetical protein